jgi:integral membrane sensor domain MASE1
VLLLPLHNLRRILTWHALVGRLMRNLLHLRNLVHLRHLVHLAHVGHLLLVWKLHMRRCLHWSVLRWWSSNSLPRCLRAHHGFHLVQTHHFLRRGRSLLGRLLLLLLLLLLRLILGLRLGLSCWARLLRLETPNISPRF